MTRVLTGRSTDPGRDGGARPVDVGHGVRRRRLRVGCGAGRRARRDRAAASTELRPRLPRGAVVTGRARPRRATGLGAAVRAAPPEHEVPRRRWARTRTDAPERCSLGRAKFQDADAAAGAGRPCPASPRWRPWAARRTRSSSRRRRTSSAPRTSRCRMSMAAVRREDGGPRRHRRRASPSDPLLSQGDAGRASSRRWPAARPTSTASWQVVVGIVIAEARRRSDGGHRARQAGDRGAPPAPAERGERLGVLYDRSELAGRVEQTLVRARDRGGRGRRAAWSCCSCCTGERAGPDGDAAAHRAADVRGDAAVRRSGDGHEPGRDRHRARHGGRRRSGRAGGLPPAARSPTAPPPAAGDGAARRRGGSVRSGDPDVAADRRAGVRAGVRVRRRDRPTAAAAGAHARRWWCSRGRSSR